MSAIRNDDGKLIDTMDLSGVLGDLLKAAAPVDENQRTPLMLAYWWGKSRAASALVKAGSDYDQQDAGGNSASWYARRFGNGELEERMSSDIGASVRRLSMQSIINQVSPPAEAPKPPAKHRRKL